MKPTIGYVHCQNRNAVYAQSLALAWLKFYKRKILLRVKAIIVIWAFVDGFAAHDFVTTMFCQGTVVPTVIVQVKAIVVHY